MKLGTLILMATMTSSAMAQTAMKQDTLCAVDLHLDMSAGEYLQRSADRGDRALFTLLIGGGMTAIAASQSERSAWIVGGITLGLSYTISLSANGDKRRAGMLVHQ